MNTNSNQNEGVPLNAFPPISLDKFLELSGLSPTTAWRYRRRGWLKTVVIAGRHYISRESIAQFNERAARGEFAGAIQNPSISRSVHGQNDARPRCSKIMQNLCAPQNPSFNRNRIEKDGPPLGLKRLDQGLPHQHAMVGFRELARRMADENRRLIIHRWPF
jgi:hypothetical protein